MNTVKCSLGMLSKLAQRHKDVRNNMNNIILKVYGINIPSNTIHPANSCKHKSSFSTASQ